MTHPDILTVERFGSLYKEEAPVKIGECLYCESGVFENNTDAVESSEGFFCDMECCCEYYEIRKIGY